MILNQNAIEKFKRNRKTRSKSWRRNQNNYYKLKRCIELENNRTGFIVLIGYLKSY